jgi:hypothetical protein
MPSQRIFFERQRSQAWAIRVCEEPHLMSFMGIIPGMVTVCGGRVDLEAVVELLYGMLYVGVRRG